MDEDELEAELDMLDDMDLDEELGDDIAAPTSLPAAAVADPDAVAVDEFGLPSAP